MKIKGISIWIWMLGVAVCGGALVATAMNLREPSAKIHPARLEVRPRLQEARQPVDPELARGSALLCFMAAQELMGGEYDEAAAKNELSKQLAAGPAQLKAIELQEAKASFGKKKDRYESALETLKSKEKASGVEGEYSETIDRFYHQGSRHIVVMMADLKYKGILDPSYKATWEKYLEIRYRARFDDVISGSFAQ
jgi:hypothetical protein